MLGWKANAVGPNLTLASAKSHSHADNGGMNIGETMAFGRIAAENAVTEEPYGIVTSPEYL